MVADSKSGKKGEVDLEVAEVDIREGPAMGVGDSGFTSPDVNVRSNEATQPWLNGSKFRSPRP